MYAAARATRIADKKAAPEPSISKLNVIYPILCLFFVAFLIAATIVLALIPLYLPQKSATAAVSPIYLLTTDYNGTLGKDGYLDSTARGVFAREIATQLGVPTDAVNVINGTVVANSNTRKRRASILLRRRRDNDKKSRVKIYIVLSLRLGPCGKKCHSEGFPRSVISIPLKLNFKFNGNEANVDTTGLFDQSTSYTVPTLANDVLTDDAAETSTTGSVTVTDADEATGAQAATVISTLAPVLVTANLAH